MINRITLKLVLAGDAGVGKTELMHAMCDKQCCAPRDCERVLGNYESTIGVNFLTTTRLLTDCDASVMCQVWDTAGRERFSEVVSAYFTGAHAILLVYDVNAPTTFDSLRSRWLPLIERRRARTTSIFIVGTKSDKLSKDSVCVGVDEAEALAAELGGYAIETNCKQQGGYLAYAVIGSVVRHVLVDRPEMLHPKEPDVPIVQVVSAATPQKPKRRRRFQFCN
jgi:Ras-related protein Rab-1A